MEDKPHLIFSLHGSFYAVEAHYVQEIIYLPELTPIAEAPNYIAGVINLRGKIVPVMDLNIRLGQTPQRYCLTDSVIVLDWEGIVMGIIVNEVCDVQNILAEEIEAVPAYGREGESRPTFVKSVAKMEKNVVVLLNLENLIRYPEYSKGIEELVEGAVIPLSAAKYSFCPQATPEEKAIFHERARDLRRPIDSEDSTELIAVAVVGLSGEYFGVELEAVREFSTLQNYRPLPCCPEHIVGVMNLRGNIVTLLDLRNVLKLPIKIPIVGGRASESESESESREGEGESGKVIVARMDDFLVGVVVDELFDVIQVRFSDITAISESMVSPSSSEGYLKGTAPYSGKTMSLLDLPKILTQGNLVVNED